MEFNQGFTAGFERNLWRLRNNIKILFIFWNINGMNSESNLSNIDKYVDSIYDDKFIIV